MTGRHLRLVDEHTPVVIDPILADDDRWFQEHPQAEFRIRLYAAGENPNPGPVPPGWLVWVKVTHVSPGVRYRQVAFAKQGDRPHSFVPEITADQQRRLDEAKASHQG